MRTGKWYEYTTLFLFFVVGSFEVSQGQAVPYRTLLIT